MSTKAFVEVTKVDLMDGEELMDLAKKVMSAITQHKGKLRKSIGLLGIFKDHIVVRDFDSGKLFRMEMKRDDRGSVNLDGMVEVRQVFVPVKQAKEKSENSMEAVSIPELTVIVEDGKLDQESVAMIEDIAKNASSEAIDPAYVKVEGESLWHGILS